MMMGSKSLLIVVVLSFLFVAANAEERKTEVETEGSYTQQVVESSFTGQEYRTVIMDVEIDDNSQAFQVGQAAPRKLEEIHSEKDAFQEGLRVALLALTSSGNLMRPDVEELLKAIPFFDKAIYLTSSVHSELSRLLVSSLLSESKASGTHGKTEITNQLNGLAFKYKNRAYERTLVYHVQGVLFEIFISDTKKSQMLYSIVRASPYKDLVEDFFDIRQNPVGYPRQKTPVASYKDYFLPLFVHSFLRDQYEGKLPLSSVPSPAEVERTGKRLAPKEFDYLELFDGQRGRNVLEEASSFFQQNEYIFFKNFISREEANLLGDYYTYTMNNPSSNVSKHWDPYLMRWTTINDRIGFFLAKQKEKVINQIVGKDDPKKMSYSFFCQYTDSQPSTQAFLNRPSLRAHTHRRDNEITVSIAVGNHPVWPINVHVKRVPDPASMWRDVPPEEESVEFHQRPGDAVIFMGRQHTNWRDALPSSSHTYDELLLHYVNAKFDHDKYRLHEND